MQTYKRTYTDVCVSETNVWTHIQYIGVLFVHIYIYIYIYKYVWTHIQYIRVLCVHIYIYICIYI